MTSEDTDIAKLYVEMLEGLRTKFDTGITLPIEFRLKQLKALYRLVDENAQRMLEVLNKDLRKAPLEGASYEVEILKTEILGTIRELKKWTNKEAAPYNLLLPFDSAFVKHDPFGVVLIIGAWNYPILLTLHPLIGAIAAGNVAVIKPSEHSKASADLIAELVPEYLDNECFKVVLGGVQETVELLENKFDYIFATSSTRIGKCIMQAAAKHLTPVTLELGGKSPVYIDDDCEIEIMTKRIIWGKFINLGQTCIAPDYILCSKSTEKKFIEAAKKILFDWYGVNPEESPDLTRIVNETNFLRLKKLLQSSSGTVVIGGSSNQTELFIAPTIVVDVKNDDSLMSEELFGPILPILTVNSKEEALKFIKARPKPLALYVFSRSKSTLNFFINKSSSGAVCCNDVIVQNAWEGLPFGGVGDSGMGRYHGKYSYDTFVHRKSVVTRPLSYIAEKIYAVRYPPYNKSNMKVLANFMKYLHIFEMRARPALSTTLIFGLVASVAATAGWFANVFYRKRNS